MLGEIEIRGVEGLSRFLRDFGKLAMEAANEGLSQCGDIAVVEAKANAPISPTKEQYSSTLKRKKRTDRQNFNPGGLEKSIECETHFGQCFVFVRENSYAGKYARRIHDEKGRTWKHRGPGTRDKGQRADEKFIERAIRDNEGIFNRIMVDELNKAIRSAK